jgi:hypothetical protein
MNRQFNRRRGLGQLSPEETENIRMENADDDVKRFMAKRRDFYTYEAQALALGVAAPITDTIQIEADSNFILQKLSAFADLAAAAQLESTRIIPLVTVQLTDTGSGRNLMSNPIPIPSLFGTGALPFVLQNPRIFMRNTTIQVVFTNFSAATTYNLRLAFIGYKVYSTV